MSFAKVLEELPAFSVEQRQLLVRRALELEEAPLSPDEEKIVEARLAAHRKEPSTSLPLNEFKARLFRRPGK